MTGALGGLLARVAQGDISAYEAKAIAAAKWTSGALPIGEDLSAFDAELKKLRDEMQTDRYALSVASRPVEEIEKILQSPHLDANTRARIKNFSFGKRYGNTKGYFFRGPLTSEDLEAARKSWAGQWPEVRAFLDAMPQPLVSPRRPKSPRSQPRGKRAPLRRPSTTRGRR